MKPEIDETYNHAPGKDPVGPMRFLARQPVFDRGMDVLGYELLFRNKREDITCSADLEFASASTLDTSAVVGLDVLCNGKRALINCTRHVLENRLVELLPPASVILEILEDVPADPEVIEACRQLRRDGYFLALDDVTSISDVEPFLNVIDMIKVDFRQTDNSQQKEIADRFAKSEIALLAEKLETEDERLYAIDLGYRYFQGFFFQKPKVVASREIPALKLNYLRLLQELQKANLDIGEIENIIKAEPSLCYRILRYLNSPMFAFSAQITSIKHALMLLGEEEVRRWLSVASLVSVGEEKPSELVVWTLTRAKFCELLGERSLREGSAAFLLGLVSSLPVLIDFPLEFVVDKLPLEPPVKEAVLGTTNKYRRVYEVVLAYEAGQWDECLKLAQSIDLKEDEVTRSYLEAVKWASESSRRSK